jgi:hypothetical protein
MPTEDEVRGWWEKWPNANVGVATGRISDLVVVDIDPHRGGDPREVHKKYPTELISRTGANGFHLFYKYPTNLDQVYNSVGEDGVDIRADGGYVVVPPSSHHSGRCYAWQLEGEPGSPPLSYISAPSGEEPKEKGSWVTDTLETGVSDGQRNHTAARLAGYFISKNTPRDITTQILLDWDKKNRPPLGEAVVRTTVASVQRTDTGCRTTPSDSWFPLLPLTRPG